MKRFIVAALVAVLGLVSVPAWSQSGGFSSPAQSAAAFVYSGVLAGIPATCTVGQLSFITDATAGQQIYECSAPNTWTQQLNSGAAGANTALSNLAAVAINSPLNLLTTAVTMSIPNESYPAWLTRNPQTIAVVTTPAHSTIELYSQTSVANGGGAFDGTVGVGSGTIASRPATCTTGVGWWATDQGSWDTTIAANTSGLFYKCTSTNTWTLFYTPYTYPHPLVTAGNSPQGVPSHGLPVELQLAPRGEVANLELVVTP
jgi:hypothetical protein